MDGCLPPDDMLCPQVPLQVPLSLPFPVTLRVSWSGGTAEFFDTPGRLSQNDSIARQRTLR